MNDMGRYWAVVSHVLGMLSMAVGGYCGYFFVKPYLVKRSAAVITGTVYFLVMLTLYLIPLEMTSTVAYMLGAAVSFVVMVSIDRRNVAQKVFVAMTIYLLRWMAGGLEFIPRLVVLFFLNTIENRPWLQLVLFTLTELFINMLTFFVFILLSMLINKTYVLKKENITQKELALLIFPLMSIVAGQWIFTYFTAVYEQDIKQYIWNVHWEYNWLLALYRGISFAAIITVLIVFQKMRKSQREEKENAILSGQIEEMRRHIGEVERLYGDMRSLRHDMGNHIMTIERLYERKEYEEAETYITQLKEHMAVTKLEVKSGNPVTDVILTEKKKEAEEKNIEFHCSFYYPQGSKLNAFDVSVILNNALTNAMEEAERCQKPFVSISSNRKNNAYLIKIENSLTCLKKLDEESGLLPTTKKDRNGHGFGLTNIRKVAQKYYGDIDITQEKGQFILNILLMTK